MPKKSDRLEWSQAIECSKATTENAFRRYANLYFWREYDLQGYMYKALYREPILRPYIRREHRIWYKDKQKQLLVLDSNDRGEESMTEFWTYGWRGGPGLLCNLKVELYAGSDPCIVKRCVSAYKSPREVM